MERETQVIGGVHWGGDRELYRGGVRLEHIATASDIGQLRAAPDREHSGGRYEQFDERRRDRSN